MYAIIADSGRQYKVEEGQELEIDYRELPPGSELAFERVLAVSGDEGLQLGQPAVEGVKVLAEVLGPTMGDKIYVQKFRKRKNSRRRTGHRQIYTKVRINKIGAGRAEEVEELQSETVEESPAGPGGELPSGPEQGSRGAGVEELQAGPGVEMPSGTGTAPELLGEKAAE
jgi:large subunit ribosomal protein L21